MESAGRKVIGHCIYRAHWRPQT